jgi:putative transcriptional regulator
MKSFLVAGLISIAAISPNAANADEGKPILLVASPAMQGFYSEATILVLPKKGGHVGFILNRASRTTLASAFPDEPRSAKLADPIYFGGPEAMKSMYAVVRRDPGEGSRRLFGEVFVTVSAKTVDRIIEQRPHEARYFAGFIAWEEGELSKEIEGGQWLMAEPDEATLFRKDTDAMWHELVERLKNTL